MNKWINHFIFIFNAFDIWVKKKKNAAINPVVFLSRSREHYFDIKVP